MALCLLEIAGGGCMECGQARDRTLIVAAMDGKVSAFTPEGELRWQKNLAQGSIAFPLALNEQEITVADSQVVATVIYGVTVSGTCFALSGMSGQVLWTYQIPGVPLSGPVVGPDNSIYLGSQIGLIALEAEIEATNRLRWIFNAPEVYMPAVDADGTVYLVSRQRIIARNPNNTPVWQYTLPAISRTPLTIGRDGRVYLATMTGVLYAINTSGPGLPEVGWPMYQLNARHTGRIGEDAYDG